MTGIGRAADGLPAHLRRYVVEQDWDAYTPRDHAVWRHVMHRLVAHLRDRAHPSYLRGLAATGIGLERIPRLDEMNERLAGFGWSAVAVRGFIPPEVFTEMQCRGVLAIAADIRSHEHVAYTPAPDILHESAGHAPILADPRYATYLRRCGEVGWKAISDREDEEVFRCIRRLSVVKEDPGATAEEVDRAVAQLSAAGAARRRPSEGLRASRLYWWTAEYGLVGPLDRPRIYGAGLLSSIGESTHCLSPAVRREPLTPACADVDYDITEMQPRLFVTPDFDALFDVLERFSAGLSFRVGGDHGLAEAARSGTVNHLVLDDGREVTGRVARLLDGERDAVPGVRTSLVVVDGPVLLSRAGTADGPARDLPAVVALGEAAGPPSGAFDLRLSSGVCLAGTGRAGGRVDGLRATLGDRPLDVPEACLLLVARGVPSVAGGPADPSAWAAGPGGHGPFATGDDEARVRSRKSASLSPELAALYAEVRRLRESGRAGPEAVESLAGRVALYPGEWLLREEVEELRAGDGASRT